MTFIDSDLPVGTHPGDQRENIGPNFDANMPIGPDVHGSQGRVGRKPFDVPADQALGVWQRASADWDVGLVVVTAANDGVSKVVGRQVGRASLALWVPTSVIINGVLTATPAGVVIAPDPGNLFQGAVLNVGDSLQLLTEASCYIGLLPGQASGYLQYVSLTNPVGGGLGST